MLINLYPTHTGTQPEGESPQESSQMGSNVANQMQEIALSAALDASGGLVHHSRTLRK